MKIRRSTVVALVFSVVAMASCSKGDTEDDSPLGTPCVYNGPRVACPCTDENLGTATCMEDGTLGPCDCSAGGLVTFLPPTGGASGAGGGGETAFMPDAACAAGYGHPNPTCVECACTPDAMMGCLDEYSACYDHPDPMFQALCVGFMDCSFAMDCKGSDCYVSGCMTEIDAATMYMGGTLADCMMGDPATSPCAAALQLSECAYDGNCSSACP